MGKTGNRASASCPDFVLLPVFGLVQASRFFPARRTAPSAAAGINLRSRVCTLAGIQGRRLVNTNSKYKQHVDKIRRGTSTHVAALDQPNFVVSQESVRAC